jgi:N6-L-threonylcarbamoyladenine synthase
MPPCILAIESSCDDTSAAVIENGRVLSNVIATQVEHEKYGGVIPELASRAHQVSILPTIEDALEKAGRSKEDLDAIAFTRGPGLLGSLLVGVMTAKGLALALDIPLVEVNHMQAHVLSHFIEEPRPDFPFICLTVSGGHTQIVRVDSPYEMTLLGSTIDDAAGEAFDKIGKMLGLDYPAGPEVDRLAQKGKPLFEFSKARIEGYDYSFSGLKTSVLYFLERKMKEDGLFVKNNMADLCASIQVNIVDVLLKKLEQACSDHGIRYVALAGGVSANSHLRFAFFELCKKHGWQAHIPDFQYCTDNAGMVAMAGHFNFERGLLSDQGAIPDPRLKVE